METKEIKSLVHAISKGDASAFKTLFDTLYPRLYRLAYYYVHSDVLSEELVSDVFMRIWNNKHHLPEINKLEIYLYQSVKHQAFTYLKKEKRRPPTEIFTSTSSLIEYNEPEKILLARELSEKIEEGISHLPDRCEMIFRLVREEGMSYKDVAELLDISRKTVENQMSIALKKLKMVLDEYQKNHSDTTYISLPYLLLFTEVILK